MSADVAAGVSKVAHQVSKSDFESLLLFTCFTLWQMDQGYDGPSWAKAIEDSICQSVPKWKAGSQVSQWVGTCKTKLPNDLLEWPSDSRFVIVYDGWLNQAGFHRNFRFSLIGATGDRLVAFHSREAV